MLIKKSGLLHTALYLKQAASSLQIAYGGEYTPSQLPTPIALTRSGYPRIIPSFHRRMIMRKDEKADHLVKVYLSFFSLARVVELAKRIDRSTFLSIIQPLDDEDRVAGVVGQMKECIVQLFKRYCPWISQIPLNQGMTWDPTWKSLPTYRMLNDFLSKRRGSRASGYRLLGRVSLLWSLKWQVTRC